MKKLRKPDRKFVEMLNAERQYRAATGGNNADEPFITPILFSLLDTLNLIFYLLCFLGGAVLTKLFIG